MIRSLRLSSWLPAIFFLGTLAPIRGQAPAPPAVPSISAGGITNAAGYANASRVSPGLIVAIFGSNLSTSAGAQPGYMPGTTSMYTSYAGTAVTFDGVGAPLYYLSPGQINAQVPFEVAGKSSSQVTVTVNSQASQPVTVPVLDATPGVFTMDGSGSGAGVLLNQDGTLNSLSNPAARGDLITVLATGLGVLSPAAGTGQAASAAPLLTCAILPTVTIGGTPVMPSPADSPYDFCGLVPGFAGLWQINVKVPAGVAIGAVPLGVVVGGVGSNPVNVFVK